MSVQLLYRIDFSAKSEQILNKIGRFGMKKNLLPNYPMP